MPRLEAASISITSGWEPSPIVIQFWQWLHWWPKPSSQFNAFANKRAIVVLPVPLGPQKRYAWAILFSFNAFDNVFTICCWPATSSKVVGRYVLYNALYDILNHLELIIHLISVQLKIKKVIIHKLKIDTEINDSSSSDPEWAPIIG